MPIACGNALVLPGDITVADDDGTVMDPVDLAPRLLDVTTRHAEWEDFSRMRRAQGSDLRKYYPLTDEVRSEYEAWQDAQRS